MVEFGLSTDKQTNKLKKYIFFILNKTRTDLYKELLRS